MNAYQLLRMYRLGADVERAHTVRHIGEYTVGKHSHGVAMLLVQFHPDPSAALLKAALTHDLHEYHCADVPPWAKGDEFHNLERKLQDDLRLAYDLDLEDSEERDWLHAADLLELLLWAREQKAMGNRNVDRIEEQVFAYFSSETSRAPAVLREVALEYKAEAQWPIGSKK